MDTEEVSVILEAHKAELRTNWEAKMDKEEVSVALEAHETVLRTRWKAKWTQRGSVLHWSLSKQIYALPDRRKRTRRRSMLHWRLTKRNYAQSGPTSSVEFHMSMNGTTSATFKMLTCRSRWKLTSTNISESRETEPSCLPVSVCLFSLRGSASASEVWNLPLHPPLREVQWI
jgi:hypothetical protein